MSSLASQVQHWDRVRSTLPLGILLDVPLKLDLTKETEAILRRPSQPYKPIVQKAPLEEEHSRTKQEKEPLPPSLPRDEPTVDPQTRPTPSPTVTPSPKVAALLDQVGRSTKNAAA